ncbi:CrcB family protein [Brachybacterium huguangmaarense]|uniref:Fluoride-specific ion channel FluC n=1 Tax=Brachybacterium huguangmaarense TaxID=1652028 RepID=A0ABY6G5E3_9MICO|nr:CrcB family protein [Brachybacterium huguangmaarense]UYG18026.1 CrcB family protein [Brachybacterium huguangmaarense]
MIVVHLLAVAVGGAAGTLARWGLTVFSRRSPRMRSTLGVPWATFAANVLGCFLLGIFVTELGTAAGGVGRTAYLLLATGFCGGLSILSTFALEVVNLSRHGTAVIAVGYLMLSAGTGLAALWAGLALAS